MGVGGTVSRLVELRERQRRLQPRTARALPLRYGDCSPKRFLGWSGIGWVAFQQDFAAQAMQEGKRTTGFDLLREAQSFVDFADHLGDALADPVDIRCFGYLIPERQDCCGIGERGGCADRQKSQQNFTYYPGARRPLHEHQFNSRYTFEHDSRVSVCPRSDLPRCRPRPPPRKPPTWPEAEKALKPETVVVIPIGAESKEHGPHLKLANDF